MHKFLPEFLFLSLAFLGWSFGSPEAQVDENPVTRPNVLLLFTDQQHVDMMSAVGNPHLHTPNMDRLAERGVLFRRSYCASPVCGPARSSILSGRMPHETGVEWNGDSMRTDIKNAGELFQEAGYRTVWGGKWHLPASYPQNPQLDQDSVRGFELIPFHPPNPENWMLGTETDPALREAVVDFISSYEQDQPLFLGVSFHNPHDICFYARKDGWVSEEDSLLDIRYYGFEYQLPEVVGTHPSLFDSLPPLPHNYLINANEPEFLTDKREHHTTYGLETHLAHQEFGDLEWRGYLNAYHRLTEMVDAEIGKVLDALESSGMLENTIIVFTSDHGDGAAAHQWAAKNNLYQEPATVPLIVSWPGQLPEGMVDDTHPVSQIDILPTLSDLAEIEHDIPFTGKTLRPLLEDKAAPWREFVVVELADYEPDRSRKGRMVRSERYKYNIYSEGERNEQLFDLEKDPGERSNLAFDPAYSEVREQHREMLSRWISQTGDTFAWPD